MAARRPSHDVASSLFPFLSVLACVIGTLTLLIAALALGQLAQDLLAENDQPLREQELARERESLERVEALLDDARRAREERVAAAAALRHLGIHPDASELERRRSVETRLRVPQLARELARLQAQAEEVDAAIIGVRTALTAERPSTDSGRIRILPHGSSEPLLPFFVECRKDGVRIYTKNLRESYYLSRGSLEDENEFRGYVQRLRSVRRATVIFLIRGDGVATYHWAANLVGRSYVRHAKLPLPGDGELEFSL